MNKITQFVVFILTADILHLKKAHHCVIYQFIKFSMKEKLKQKLYKINDRFSGNKQQYIDKDSIGYLHFKYKVKKNDFLGF